MHIYLNYPDSREVSHFVYVYLNYPERREINPFQVHVYFQLVVSAFQLQHSFLPPARF